MTRQPYADLRARAYTRTGKTAHLLQPFQSPNGNGAALCGTAPEWSDAWRGTGSQAEIETVASLPLCKRCERRASAADAAAARIAALGQQERAS